MMSCIPLKNFRRDARKIPDISGVYLFKQGRKILYIGKAASLRDRIRSYFSRDLMNTRSPAVVGMVEKATSVTWQKCGSVLEALILEASMIRKHKSPFNVQQKDDKSWNYVVITDEKFPRVLLVRGRTLEVGSWELEARKTKLQNTLGPFPHAGQLKEALRIVRKVFPFRDKCVPCKLPKTSVFVNSNELTNTKSGEGRCTPCFNAQIGLCPGACAGEITEKEYAKTIRNIRDIFGGNFKSIKRRLALEMKTAAKSEKFEKAAELRKQLFALEHIRDVSLITGERMPSGGSVRIEAYDIAHTGGAETVGVMAVLENGETISGAHRKFKIHSVRNNDIAALKEVFTRRLAHDEWILPHIFVVDGGKAQIRAAEKILHDVGISIPIVGVVKDECHKPKRLIGDSRIIKSHENDILKANHEAHRYAIGYHRKRLTARY